MKCTIRVMLPALFVLAPAVVWADAKDDAKAAIKKLEGTWKVKSMEVSGKKEAPPAEMLEKMRLVFGNGKITIKGGPEGKEREMAFEIDATKKPAHITIQPPKEEKSEKSLIGIYKIDGNTLTICGNEGGDRPTEFALKEGTKIGMIVLERVKE